MVKVQQGINGISPTSVRMALVLSKLSATTQAFHFFVRVRICLNYKYPIQYILSINAADLRSFRSNNELYRERSLWMILNVQLEDLTVATGDGWN